MATFMKLTYTTEAQISTIVRRLASAKSNGGLTALVLLETLLKRGKGLYDGFASSFAKPKSRASQALN